MKFTDQQLANYIYYCTKDKNSIETDRFAKQFASYLIRIKRKDHLNNIIRLYRSHLEKEEGIYNVEVITKYPLKPATLDYISNIIKGKFGENARIKIHQIINNNLLGGLKIKIRNELLDATIDTQYKNISKKLFI